MVRFLVLYDTPEDPAVFDKHYSEVHIPLAKQLPGESMADMQAAFSSEIGQRTAADVPTFAPTGVTSVVYEVAEV
jgi:hypothetical protein